MQKINEVSTYEWACSADNAILHTNNLNSIVVEAGHCERASGHQLWGILHVHTVHACNTADDSDRG